MKKRISGASIALIISIIFAAGLCGCGSTAGSTAGTSSGTAANETADGSYSLSFSDCSGSSQSLTVCIDSISYSIIYTLYQNIVYAASPVDASYESMNVYVPTEINGSSVDASSSPILFEIGVGGYSKCSTWGTTSLSTNGQYALVSGYVVVQPGCRGRDNGSSGNYYGKAPAAIVDLKAAVRYIRYNSGTIPGNVDRIISSGGSAGGALSALLGASGNSSLYESCLSAIGAADAEDNIYAVGAWSPITDLDHADMCYEWEYGSAYCGSGTVNQTISGELQTLFETYENGLGLTGRGSYGTLTADNIRDYILAEYLEPSAAAYLADGHTNSWSSWLTYSGSSASFSFSDYVSAIGRGKSVPAFDSFFDSSSYSDTNTSTTAENLEFGTSSTNYQHFTDYSLEKTSENSSAAVSSDTQTIINMMNPMYFIIGAGAGTSDLASYWYIRDGSAATDTSAIVIVNLATALENKLGTAYVDVWEDWNQGHNVNADPGGFLSWEKTAAGS